LLIEISLRAARLLRPVVLKELVHILDSVTPLIGFFAARAIVP
jgi:hypothetical protein